MITKNRKSIEIYMMVVKNGLISPWRVLLVCELLCGVFAVQPAFARSSRLFSQSAPRNPIAMPAAGTGAPAPRAKSPADLHVIYYDQDKQFPVPSAPWVEGDAPQRGQPHVQIYVTGRERGNQVIDPATKSFIEFDGCIEMDDKGSHNLRDPSLDDMEEGKVFAAELGLASTAEVLEKFVDVASFRVVG